MGYSSIIALKEEQQAAYEQAYIRQEQITEANKLMNAIFFPNIKKLTRKEAKGRYLYRRLDGSLKIV